MPSIVDKYTVHKDFGKEKDKRVKLSPEQKDKIRELYKGGGYSQRDLAGEFNVSRRTIRFILDPEKLKRNLQARQERGGTKQYYDKNKHKEYMKEHRKHKKELLEEKNNYDKNKKTT